MIRAKHQDKGLVINILSESFKKNKSVLSVVGNNKNKIPLLMDYSFEKGILDGEIWINNMRTAALIALYPNRSKHLFKGLMLDVKLLFSVIGLKRLYKILNRERAIKSKQPKSDFIHLWYIGVLNFHQNTGQGSKLLREFLELKREKNIPVYLETSTEKNLSFYKKIGFGLVEEIRDKLPYTLYIFAKNPE
tara:strand:+ start:1804 stop:2376 length:573 start_codon:yes stop_codon:yes gene_type:complete